MPKFGELFAVFLFYTNCTNYSGVILMMRKQTIERIFADAKEKHGMRWTRCRGLEKVATHTMLTFAAMNLKKLATWLWKTKNPMAFYFKFVNKGII
ncbi:hypothetical protein D920_00226 [Enterococcus faecalis 13-SD-W-01]|nr:hypothetical protein D920_00226 [Enterococcus faecalis 13-SD-W-01]